MNDWVTYKKSQGKKQSKGKKESSGDSAWGATCVFGQPRFDLNFPNSLRLKMASHVDIMAKIWKQETCILGGFALCYYWLILHSFIQQALMEPSFCYT